MTGYIHRSQGTPGVSSGSVWSQGALLRLTGATVESAFTTYPTELANGTLVTPGAVVENVVPVPAFVPGPVRLELRSAAGQVMTIRGETIELSVVGEPLYVEDFSG
jgi:hypothetical protein